MLTGKHLPLLRSRRLRATCSRLSVTKIVHLPRVRPRIAFTIPVALAPKNRSFTFLASGACSIVRLCGVSFGFNLMGQPKEENNEQEARRHGDRRRGKYLPERMSLLARKNEPFPPLTSASPRLLFDFSRFNEP